MSEPSILKDWELFKAECKPFEDHGIPAQYSDQVESVFLCGAYCGVTSVFAIVSKLASEPKPTAKDIESQLTKLSDEIQARVKLLADRESERKTP